MRIVLLFLAFFSLESAFSQVRVVSLFEKDAMATGRFLPFKVYVNDEVQSIDQVIVNGGCHGIVDSDRPQIFFLYCANKAVVSGNIDLANGLIVPIEEIQVRSVSVFDVPDLETGEENFGRDLFVSNCSSCHPANPIRTPTSSKDLVDALGRGPMKARGLDLLIGSDSEKVSALVEYINGGG